MKAVHAKFETGRVDPLIDEVRANRRKLVAAFDNDLDALADHLRKAQADYEKRTCQFADLPRHVSEEPASAKKKAPTIRNLRSLRTSRGKMPKRLQRQP